MIVVVDSNIWLSTLALRSNLGAVALFYLSQRGATIAVPEVVRLEVENNLRTGLFEAADLVQSNHRRLLAAFGTLKEVVVPTRSDIERVVETAFAIERPSLRHLPLSLESARSSFLKTVTKEPPSHRNQQFKDGVIWADCIQLLDEDDVILVSSDKAFFEGDDIKNGLSKKLEAEAVSKPHRIRLLSALSELLDEVRTPIHIEPSILFVAFQASEGGNFARLLVANGFSLGPLLHCSTKLYATSDPRKLYIDFKLELEAISNVGGGNGILILAGNSLYVPQEARFEAMQSGGEELHFHSDDGEQTRKSIVIAVGSIVLGHADVTHAVRHPL